MESRTDALDLNTATPEQLQQLPHMGPDNAETVRKNRPLKSWDDVERLPGFSKQMVDELVKAGVILGGADSGE
ncbi:MAG: helix-hairpin-helix domain-containing protein [Bryobacterales bacterium]|nr:helix-hairpin-helix domain-containing protein [Bryobacterales bacterium]